MMPSCSGGLACLLILLCAGWNGCSFTSGSGADEEKDSNYLTGRSRKSALNYAGAIESFEKALEANPRSAPAHLELGLIYYQNITTHWARAIYHFEKYLELRPKANNADLIRQNMEYCKLALAKDVPYTPSNDLIGREVEHLSRENAALHQQVEQLKAQLALQTPPATNGVVAPNSKPVSAAASNVLLAFAQAPERHGAPASSNDPARAPVARVHVVRSGETPYAIARNYGLKLATLVSANPGMDARRLKPGQTLVIPRP